MKTIGCAALAMVLGLGGFAGSAAALQEKKKGGEAAKPTAQSATPEQRLAQGKLVADSEHDPERALTLLGALAADASVKSEVRAQALVAAARCLNQLGRGDEAKVKLQAAAQLNGPGADEAKHLLEGGFTDQQLELRIAKAIDEVMSMSSPGNLPVLELAKTRPCQDLIWVGAPAVPRLSRFLADVDHLPNVTAATFLLASINTDEAATAVRDALMQADPFYKRAVLAAFPPNTVWSDPIRAAVMTLLNDADPHVRQWVLTDASRLATEKELLPLTRDADDSVRKSAWHAIRSRDRGSDVDALVAALRRCLKEDGDEVRLEAVEMLRSERILESDSGRALYAETLLDPILTAPVGGKTPHWLRGDAKVLFDRPIAIDLLVHVAEKLGTVGTVGVDGVTRFQAPGGDAFDDLVRRSASAAVEGSSHLGWPAAERTKVWPLLRFGVGGVMGEWIQRNATADDVPAIAEYATACGDVNTVAGVVRRREVKLSPAQRSAVAKSLLRLFAADTADWERLTGKPPQPFQRWQFMLSLLLELGDDEADRAVVRAQAVIPDVSLLNQLLNRVDPPVDPQRLVELVTATTGRRNEDDRARNRALGRIAAARLPELPKLVVRCYELGLEAEVVPGPSGGQARPRGFVWLVAREPDPNEEASPRRGAASRDPQKSRNSGRSATRADWAPSYPEADVRFAFEECARMGAGGFWWDVASALDLLPDEGPFDPVATAFLELVTAKVATIPEERLRTAGALRSGLAREVLQRRAPGWKEFALAHCLDGELGETIVTSVPEFTAELVQKVAESPLEGTVKSRRLLVQALGYGQDEALRARAVDFLRDPSGEVRSAAIGSVLRVAPDRALDLLLPLAKDPDSRVRYALYESLASTFDRRAIPVLVDGLQDSAAGNREVAKKSLDSIQYVFEQKDKWKRMLEGAGLDSANAAEALVKQAAANQPKAARLIAIESLGTLGVAETLPVLISFMGDSDAEIAAAAKAAVEKINRRTAERETGPAGKKPSERGQ
jgi:HEAT repeat protein